MTGGYQRSKRVSKVVRCAGRLSTQAAYACRRASRSSSSIAPSARVQSSTSASDTVRPAWRSASRNAISRSTSPVAMSVQLQLLDGAGVVAGVLEDDTERLVHRLLVEGVEAEGDERLRPVDGLRDRRALLQLQSAQSAD